MCRITIVFCMFVLLPGLIGVSAQDWSLRQRSYKHRRCRYHGIYYQRGQQLSFDVGKKRFDCTCMYGGRLDCTMTYLTPPENSKCDDSASGQRKNIGEKWERIVRGEIFDCVCNREKSGLQIVCSDENRCHHRGFSYTKGIVFNTYDSSGRQMKCTCLGKKRIECRYEVELPGPERDEQLIENYVVHGGKSIRPQITTLQACRTGDKVVTSGVVWNQTVTNALGARTLQSCTCLDAIVRCDTIRELDGIEPHCVSSNGRRWEVGDKWLRVRQHFPSQKYECVCSSHQNITCRRVRRARCVDKLDGTIRIAGEKWIRVHESFANLKFECTCYSNGKMHCKDIGKCDDPSAPANGALLCANVGGGSGQVTYCKPMCLSDYEFINNQRYYRIWEVCGSMNLHRWSGGFAGDPSAIARCTARTSGGRRGHDNLYLPTNYCDALTTSEIEKLKTLFLQQLHYRNLCGNKCEITVFKCGVKE